MILDWDKNFLPVIWDGNSKYVDLHGFNISTTGKTSHFEQRGQVTGIDIASTGLKTAAVVFTTPYVNVLDEVFVELHDATATDAVFGGAFVTGDSVTGFTLNVHVITASATSGATMKANWKALGN